METTPTTDHVPLHLKYKEEIFAIFILICISAIALTFADTNKNDKSKDSISSSKNQRAWKSNDDLRKQGKLKKADTVLEVNFSYNKDAANALAITSTKVTQGYVSRQKVNDAEYKLQLLNAKGAVIKESPFSVPDEVYGPPSEPGKKSAQGDIHDSITLSKTNFTVTVGWDPSVASVNVLSADGNTVASQVLTNTAFVSEPAPVSYTITGTQFLASTSSVVATDSTSTASNTIDIAFIGDSYTDLNVFHDDVNRFIAQWLAIEPYKSRASQLVFHYVDNTTNLNCTYSGRIIVCDNALISQILNSAGVPYDYVSVIENNPTYGGATTNGVAVQYNGSYGPLINTHEIGGHAIGKVADEYILSQVEGTMANCTASPTSTSWTSVVAPGDTYLGCDYPNYYRSSFDSIMLDLDSSYFNVKSQQAINAQMDLLAGPFVDTVAPTAVITSPSASSTVLGVVTVTGTYSDDNGIARVELWKDGKLYHTEYVAPFNLSWSTALETNGVHTLQVKAYDVAGNVGTSDVVSVVTNNPVDTTAPTVKILSVFPSGTPTSTSVTLAQDQFLGLYAAATDDSGAIQKLEIWKDNTTITYTVASSTGWMWYYAPTYGYGTHKFTIKAYDNSGNVGSTTQTINVLPPPDITPPTVTIKSPVNGTKLSRSGSTTISGSSSDASGIAQMQIFMDGKTLKTCLSTTSCSTSVSNSSITTGTHIIVINAKDKANNTATSTVTVTK